MFKSIRLKRNSAFWEGLDQRWGKLIEAGIILTIALMPVLNTWEGLLGLTFLLYLIRFPERKLPDTGLFIFWLSLAVSAFVVLGFNGLNRLAPITVWLLTAGLVGRTFSPGFSCKVLRYILISSLFWMLIGFWQQWSAVPTPSGWLERGEDLLISVRSYSVFGNPNIYGLYLLSILIFALLGTTLTNLHYPIVSWLLFVLTVISLFFTYSRTAWFLAFAAVGGWFGRRFFSRRFFYVLIVIGFLFFLTGFKTRIISSVNFENTFWFRVRIWQSMLKLLAEYWKWGSGPGSFVEVFPNNQIVNGLVLHGHQLYMQLWLESGILSLIAFIRVIVKNLAGFFGLKSSAKAVALVILLFLIDGFLETWWANQYCGGYFWLLIGLLQTMRAGQIAS